MPPLLAFGLTSDKSEAIYLTEEEATFFTDRIYETSDLAELKPWGIGSSDDWSHRIESADAPGFVVLKFEINDGRSGWLSIRKLSEV